MDSDSASRTAAIISIEQSSARARGKDLAQRISSLLKLVTVDDVDE